MSISGGLSALVDAEYGHAGQRLAAQKGQSDDLVGAMNAQAKHGQLEDEASDEED